MFPFESACMKTMMLCKSLNIADVFMEFFLSTILIYECFIKQLYFNLKQLLHLNYNDSKMWNDDLWSSQLLSRWNNSQVDITATNVCGVGKRPQKACKHVGYLPPFVGLVMDEDWGGKMGSRFNNEHNSKEDLLWSIGGGKEHFTLTKQLLHFNSESSKTSNDNLWNLYSLSRWNNSQADLTTTNIYGVGSAHNRLANMWAIATFCSFWSCKKSGKRTRSRFNNERTSREDLLWIIKEKRKQLYFNLLHFLHLNYDDYETWNNNLQKIVIAN